MSLVAAALEGASDEGKDGRSGTTSDIKGLHKHPEDRRAAMVDMALIVSHAPSKEASVADYNDRRYHESIDNLTPADDLLRARPDNRAAERKDQTPDHRPTPLAAFNV
jgi:hypothetical protein